jgi:hypothetical protein
MWFSSRPLSKQKGSISKYDKDSYNILYNLLFTIILFFNTVLSPPPGATARSVTGPHHHRGFTITDTPHSAGLLRTDYQPVADTST